MEDENKLLKFKEQADQLFKEKFLRGVSKF